MPVTVNFPSTLPCVSRIDGYAMTAAAACLRTPFEAGNTRQRRMHARLPMEIALAWRVRNVDLYPLVSWLNVYGFDWFNLKLAGLEASQANVYAMSIAVRLMSDLRVQLAQFHRDNWWTVAASAEYQAPPLALVPAGVGTVAVGSPGLSALAAH
jgi:hypothetical protein